jgi:riboflavin synthase
MFTGIVEEIGHVRSIQHGSQSARLVIQARKVLENTRIGDSIAINGICLTVTGLAADSFTADVMPETLRRTSLGQLTSHSPVNLERALCLGDRLGGHLVSGHIDGTVKLVKKQREGNAIPLRISAEPGLLRYIIAKGSVTLDGVSLTVTTVDTTSFAVSLIPHTAGETTLGERVVGDVINIECDMIGKYVEKLLFLGPPEDDRGQAAGTAQDSSIGQSRIDLAFLRDNGF